MNCATAMFVANCYVVGQKKSRTPRWHPALAKRDRRAAISSVAPLKRRPTYTQTMLLLEAEAHAQPSLKPGVEQIVLQVARILRVGAIGRCREKRVVVVPVGQVRVRQADFRGRAPRTVDAVE